MSRRIRNGKSACAAHRLINLILVSTTVIEVGMDVPNASVMVIEQAERFGLAQLHQLRGRVGRGAAQSYCILVTEKMNDTARARIRTLVESTDGFYISEMDLKLRGPGEVFGTRQSGLPSLRVANILRDGEILEIARREAVDFIAHPPDPEDLRRAVAYIRDHWQRRFRAMPRVPRRTACARRSSTSWRCESKARSFWTRSEERRVGKECRSRWSPYH